MFGIESVATGVILAISAILLFDLGTTFQAKVATIVVSVLALMGIGWTSWNMELIIGFVKSGSWVSPLVWYVVFGVFWFIVELIVRIAKTKSALRDWLQRQLSEESFATVNKFVANGRNPDDVSDQVFEAVAVAARFISNQNQLDRLINVESNFKFKLDASAVRDLAANVILVSPLFVVHFVFARMMRSLYTSVANYVTKTFGGAFTRYFDNLME